MRLISFLVYIPLQIAFIPLAIAGVVLVAYRQMIVSKKMGISQTAIEVINGRWTMHVFGLRSDVATANLAAKLPNTSIFGLWLVIFPLWVKYKISGERFLYPRIPDSGAENLSDLFIARTLYFDRIIESAIGTIDQFVLMGAGYDTRAYRGVNPHQMTFFELDQPDVQAHKLEALEKANISCDHVHFVSVDFTRDNVFEKLAEAGYDPDKKTLFLWEGVTLYLSEAEVRKTMRSVSSHACKNSILLADIYANRMLNIAKSTVGKQVMDYTNEGLGFGLDLNTSWKDVLLGFVESESLSLGEAIFMGSDSDSGPFMVVVEMRC
jgi:methyltransferase (TIGR00027 family)